MRRYTSGLCLKYTVAVPLIGSCSFAALKDVELRTEDDLHHFTLCLEFKSNVVYSLGKKECAKWITENKYQDSIYNVIGNAIADCVLKRCRFSEDKIKNGVLIFAPN